MGKTKLEVRRPAGVDKGLIPATRDGAGTKKPTIEWFHPSKPVLKDLLESSSFEIVVIGTAPKRKFTIRPKWKEEENCVPQIKEIKGIERVVWVKEQPIPAYADGDNGWKEYPDGHWEDDSCIVTVRDYKQKEKKARRRLSQTTERGKDRKAKSTPEWRQELKKGGWHMYNNALTEKIYKDSYWPVKTRILMYISRHTFGWQRPSMYISQVGLAEELGVTRSMISQKLKELKEKNVLFCEKHRRWGINRDVSIYQNG